MAMVLVHSALVNVIDSLPTQLDTRTREQLCSRALGGCSRNGKLRAVRAQLCKAAELADVILLPTKEYVSDHSLEWATNSCLFREYIYLLSEVPYLSEKVIFLETDEIPPSLESTLCNLS